MLIVLSIICIGLLPLFNWRYKKADYGDDEGWIIGMVLAIIGLLTCISLICVAINFTIKIPQMDNRIALYQEENSRIEEQAKTTIEVYQDYEKEIFGNIDLDKISSEKLILLTSIYPELKSDVMIQELIQIYINNTNEIKQLKIDKFNHELWRWWLYFG